VAAHLGVVGDTLSQEQNSSDQTFAYQASVGSLDEAMTIFT
jgi:hypothetical protein